MNPEIPQPSPNPPGSKLIPVPTYIDAEDVCLYYTIMQNHIWPMHCHDKHQILIIPEVHSKCEISWIADGSERKSASLTGQYIIHIEKGVSHEFRAGNGGVLISLGISDKEVERVTMGNHWHGVRIDQWWRVNKEDGFIWNIVQVLRAYCYQKSKTDLRGQKAHARVLVSHLLAADKHRKATTIGGLTPLQLRNVETYIENHFRDRPLVDDLAAVAGLKRDHFSHLFKNSTGFTPHQFIIALRLEYVRRLKNIGIMTNAQIAADAGFYDESHLINTIKHFRRKYPKNYHGILLPITDSSNSITE